MKTQPPFVETNVSVHNKRKYTHYTPKIEPPQARKKIIIAQNNGMVVPSPRYPIITTMNNLKNDIKNKGTELSAEDLDRIVNCLSLQHKGDVGQVIRVPSEAEMKRMAATKTIETKREVKKSNGGKGEGEEKNKEKERGREREKEEKEEKEEYFVEGSKLGKFIKETLVLTTKDAESGELTTFEVSYNLVFFFDPVRKTVDLCDKIELDTKISVVKPIVPAPGTENKSASPKEASTDEPKSIISISNLLNREEGGGKSIDLTREETNEEERRKAKEAEKKKLIEEIRQLKRLKIKEKNGNKPGRFFRLDFEQKRNVTDMIFKSNGRKYFQNHVGTGYVPWYRLLKAEKKENATPVSDTYEKYSNTSKLVSGLGFPIISSEDVKKNLMVPVDERKLKGDGPRSFKSAVTRFYDIVAKKKKENDKENLNAEEQKDNDENDEDYEYKILEGDTIRRREETKTFTDYLIG